MIGLPEKNGKPIPMLKYELDLVDLLAKEKHVWIKKSTGLGISEFTLRYLAWSCLKDDTMRNKHKDIDILIICGPRLDLAITLMDRLKNLFQDYNFTQKNTVLDLNGVRIECFPSHHLAAARGLSPQFVFLDEADFFKISEQQECRSIAERYITKSNPWILFVSTPNNPGGLYQQMEEEEPSIYHKVFLDYKVGIRDGMWTEEEIEAGKLSPSFEREYNLQYGIGTGNIFFVDDIIENYPLEMSHGQKVLCCDPAYGSSKFGIVGFEKIDGIIYIKEALQFERASPAAMLERITLMAKDYGNYVLVDSAHPGLILDLTKNGVNAHAVKFGSMVDGKPVNQGNSLLSVMTIDAAQAVKEKRVRIHHSFKDLIAQLRAIRFNDKGHPDKKELTFDMGDCFLMGCHHLRSNSLKVIKM